jgi:hypothetical protein
MSRTARRNGEVKRRQELRRKNAKAKQQFTRAKAEKVIAQAIDPGILQEERIAKHKNSHVTKKARHKLGRLI